MTQIVSTIPHDTGGRLAREWARLRTRPDVLRRAARWRVVDGRIDDLDQVLESIGFHQERTTANEERLRRLVLLAADDELAGWVVIQRLLPGLLAVVSRRRRQTGSADVFDELLGAAWMTIRTFNPDRRPACLAAALISDADYRAFRAPGRRRRIDCQTLDEESAPPSDVDPHPGDELRSLFDDAIAAGVPEGDIALLQQIIDAPTTKELARQLRITPRTIRNRRAKITDRLRAVALAA